MFDENFFRNVSVLCRNLAPVASPFLESTSNLAAALHNTQIETQQAAQLTQRIEQFRQPGVIPDSPSELFRHLTEAED